MMKTVKAIIVAGLLTSTAVMAGKNVAPAASPVVPVLNPIPLYVGLGLLWTGTSVDCPCAKDKRLKDNTYGGILRVGYDFNPYIGVEGRIFKSSMSKNFSETTHYGIYLKPQYHVTDALNVYGLIGYGNTKIECDYKGTIYDDSGFSFGIGMEYDMSKDSDALASNRTFDGQGDQEKGWGLWVDYQNLLHNEGSLDIKSNIVTAGVTYDF
jgi:OOP family OmpA-OmpF porin